VQKVQKQQIWMRREV